MLNGWNNTSKGYKNYFAYIATLTGKEQKNKEVWEIILHVH
jgi:hypothetical protein